MLVDLGLAAVAATVMLAIDRMDRRIAWTDMEPGIDTVPAVILFLVIVGLSAALVIRQPLYGFYTWTGYFWAWRLLPGRSRFAGRGAGRTGDGGLADRSRPLQELL